MRVRLKISIRKGTRIEETHIKGTFLLAFWAPDPEKLGVFKMIHLLFARDAVLKYAKSCNDS